MVKNLPANAGDTRNMEFDGSGSSLKKIVPTPEFLLGKISWTEGARPG